MNEAEEFINHINNPLNKIVLVFEIYDPKGETSYLNGKVNKLSYTRYQGGKYNFEYIADTGNTYKGITTANYREVWGKVNYGRSVGNTVTKDGGNRAMINISDSDHFAVMNFNGYDDAKTSLWLIEATNGTINSEVVNSSALNMGSGVLVGGSAAAGVTDVGGNFITF